MAWQWVEPKGKRGQQQQAKGNTKGGKYKGAGALQQSWGRWRCCACGNVQTGSECKGCRAKWWTVEWQRAEEPQGGHSNRPRTTKSQAWSSFGSGVRLFGQPSWADGAQLQSALASMAQSKRGVPDNPEVQELAAQLRDKLRESEPKKQKTARLQSVMDQLKDRKAKRESNRKLIAELAQSLEEAEAEAKRLDDDIARLTTEQTATMDEIRDAPPTPPGEEDDDDDPPDDDPHDDDDPTDRMSDEMPERGPSQRGRPAHRQDRARGRTSDEDAGGWKHVGPSPVEQILAQIATIAREVQDLKSRVYEPKRRRTKDSQESARDTDSDGGRSNI